MMATTMPRTTPMIMAPTVPRIVPLIRPFRTGDWTMIWAARLKSHLPLVTNELTIMAMMTAMIATATQRHGCRTGRASMRPGRSVADDAVTADEAVTG